MERGVRGDGGGGRRQRHGVERVEHDEQLPNDVGTDLVIVRTIVGHHSIVI